MAFPALSDLKRQDIMEAAMRVNTGKAGAWDGVSDRLFQVFRKCCRAGQCQECQHKMKFVEQLFQPSYWEQEETHVHMTSVLVCLNKKFPLTPSVPDYRPISVASPCVKCLEGLLYPKLKAYAVLKMHSWQLGFTPRVGIEECKHDVLHQIHSMESPPNWRAKPHALFIDYKAAYDSVDRDILYRKLA